MVEDSFDDLSIDYIGVVDLDLKGGILCRKINMIPNNKFDRKRHYHTFYELHYISKGSILFDVNNLTILHKEGTVHLVRPRDHHTLIYIGDAEYYTLQFQRELMQPEIMEAIEDYPQILAVQAAEKDRDDFTADCERLSELCKNPYEKFWQIELASQLQLFLIRFLKELQADSQEQPLTGREYAIVNKILEYVRVHYMQDISLEDVSMYVGFSKSYLSSFFSTVMNMTFWNYLTVYRLERARMMLSSTNVSVAQIAYACGFNSYNTFVKAFRKRYSVSPTQYRKR